MKNYSQVSRSEKINTIQKLLARKVSLAEITPIQVYLWSKECENYVLDNTGAAGLKLNKREYEQYTAARRNSNHIVFTPCEDCEPVDYNSRVR